MRGRRPSLLDRAAWMISYEGISFRFPRAATAGLLRSILVVTLLMSLAVTLPGNDATGMKPRAETLTLGNVSTCHTHLSDHTARGAASSVLWTEPGGQRLQKSPAETRGSSSTWTSAESWLSPAPSAQREPVRRFPLDSVIL